MSAPSGITLLFSGLPAVSDKFLMGISTVALLRIPGRTILFDTGPYAYRPILQGRVKRIGVDPGDVDVVVLSHVHWEVAANADLFPRADILIHANEMEYADTSASHDALTAAYVGRTLRKLKLRPVISEVDPAADVRLVAFPGHTPGSIGLLVHNTLLSGDVIYGASDAVAGNPREAAYDVEQARASLAKAMGFAVIVYPGHDRPFRVVRGSSISPITHHECACSRIPPGRMKKFGSAALRQSPSRVGQSIRPQTRSACGRNRNVRCRLLRRESRHP